MEIDLKQIKTIGASTDYDALFRKYYAPMVLFATRLLKDKEAAEDIVQEVFVQLIQQGKPLDERKSISNYLTTILHNKIIDVFRKAKHMPTEQLDERLVEETVENTALEIDLYTKLYEEVEKLPEKNAQVMRLKLQGKSDHEIAEILGIKYETVRSHVKHGISKLRDKFDLVLLLAIFG
ncbi:MAG: sigma-70 family RNA polymerase sigma factor [Prevotella sp.]|nr:sigma-70 family RNA polymerase sigma factor [Prevotella sp.]